MAQNEACILEHLFEHTSSEGHCGFFGKDSITLKDMADG